MRKLVIVLLLTLTLPGSLTAGPLVLHDQVLKTDTVWSGEILIEGVIVVGRKATLIIEPGTVIRFRKIDRNDDGIGDAEIRVLGRLLANGTYEERIRFESAETNTAAKDWSYILFYTSGKKSELRYCTFSHAFSGVQAHFSTARITDCLFINNYEGMRFGRADLIITHNIFKNNETGIRFTRMEGPVEIRHNIITGNRTGIFLAPSGQNIKDFFDPDQGGKAWNTGRLLITANNIHDNDWYDLNLGEKQIWDLDVAGNWWGTADPGRFNEKIFDRRRDPVLGRAIFAPTATAPFLDAGVRTAPGSEL